MNQPKQRLATGRRKSAVATVQLMPGSGDWNINRKTFSNYLQYNRHFMKKIQQPFHYLEVPDVFDMNFIVRGGGIISQVDAMQLALCRALCLWKPEYRYALKLKGYLSRDARVKERKKYGLKKARKAGQFSKR